MSNAFETRKPWAAALIGLIFGPVITMLYLGRGRTAAFYFIVVCVISVAILLLPAYGIVDWDASRVAIFFGFIWRLFGAVLGWCNKHVFVTKWYTHWYSVVGFILLPYVLIVGALEMREFVYEPFHITTLAMQPTLTQSDNVLFDKTVYDNRLPARGDIILLANPNDESEYIRRVIGLPGDVVQLKTGILYINDKAVPRQIFAPGVGEANACTEYVETLPEGKAIHVWQCNAAFADSIQYTVPAGQYFILGDNRDASEDSRGPLGYVPLENIEGRASVIYWNDKSGLELKSIN